MKKGTVGLIFGVLFLFVTFIGGEEVRAENQINNLDIQIELQEDGSGIITETRDMYVDDGTELYITMEDLQDSEVLNFSVEGYTFIQEWDSDASMEQKAGKYGTSENDGELELIWGMGEHGENTYEITYTLSNLVRELEDGQGLLWNFDTFSDIPAENVTVEVSGPEPFTEDNVRFWGFGFEGDMQLSEDNIIWEARETLENDDVTTLLQFPSGAFNTNVSAEMTLEEQREMALDGSSYNNPPTPMWVFILIGVFIALSLAILIGVIIYSVKLSKAKKEAGQMVVGGKRLKKNDGLYYEQVPYLGDIADIAYLLQQAHAGHFEEYFSAYLLKWVNDGWIDIHTEEEDSFFW